MSRVTAIISALVICIIVCLSWANHYRDNAITYKAQRDKYEELKLANAAITDVQMRQRDVAALDAKPHTKELWSHKAENDALRDDVAAGRRQFCASKQSVSQCVKLPPPAWIMQPPRLADTAERDYFCPQKTDHWQKQQLEGTRSVNERCR